MNTRDAAVFVPAFGEQKSETRMTASVLKQDPKTEKVW